MLELQSRLEGRAPITAGRMDALAATKGKKK
jgi:hypothetical protein